MQQPDTPIETALSLEPDQELARTLRRDGIGTVGDLREHLLKRGIKGFMQNTRISASALRIALGGSLRESVLSYSLYRAWNLLCAVLLVVQLVLVGLFFREVIGTNGLYRLILPVIVVASVVFASLHQSITRHFSLSRTQYVLSGLVFGLALVANGLAEPVGKWLTSRPSSPSISNTEGFFSVGNLVTEIKVTHGNGTFVIPSELLDVSVQDTWHTFVPEREVLLPRVKELKMQAFQHTGQTFDPGSTVAVTQANKERLPDGRWQYNFTFARSDRVRYWAVHDAAALAQRDPELGQFKELVDSLRGRQLVFEASTAFGVYVMLRSADGVFILGRRDPSAHTKRAIWTASVNQGINFDRDCVERRHHRNPIFNAMYAGLHSELGIPQSEVKTLHVLAVGYDRYHHYGAVGIAYCEMASSEIKDRLAATNPSEIGGAEVLPTQPVAAVKKMLQLGEWDDGAIINIVLALIFENNKQGLDVSRKLRRAGIEQLKHVPS
jgi:hypothetical protein